MKSTKISLVLNLVVCSTLFAIKEMLYDWKFEKVMYSTTTLMTSLSTIVTKEWLISIKVLSKNEIIIICWSEKVSLKNKRKSSDHCNHWHYWIVVIVETIELMLSKSWWDLNCKIRLMLSLLQKSYDQNYVWVKTWHSLSKIEIFMYHHD